jgi:6-pyruvoyltetrahydropterin/6-carboxytetrahydropterin synthase
MPKVTITSSFRFEASHVVPLGILNGEPHPCTAPHGHSYLCEVSLTGEIDPGPMVPGAEPCIVLDYFDLASACEPIRKMLDHKCLNSIQGLERPSAEVITVWIWRQLKEHPTVGPLLSELTLHEGATARCTYRGE